MHTRSLAVSTFATLLSSLACAAGDSTTPDPGCESYQSWQIQSSVKSNTVGNRNNAYPEANATYWATVLQPPAGAGMFVRGRYPYARYMAFQLYDAARNVIDAINDQSIVPDPGQNNPFQTGTEAGAYTIQIVFGQKPPQPAPNTIYTNLVPDAILIYRIYYSTNSTDLTGGTVDPVLPEVYSAGSLLSACPVRPIIQPEDNSVWGRLDNADFSGVSPPSLLVRATNPPIWLLSVTNPYTPYYPSQDNSYMSAVVNRDFLNTPYSNELVVVRIKAPTFANTNGGEPPYLATTTRQVRFWSICTNEMMSTSVVRCVPDYQVPLRDGYGAVVISDPSKKPSDQVLAQHSAAWLPWGALFPGDSVYDIDDNVLDNSSGVYYQGLVIYRQTIPNPTWTQSFTAIGLLPRDQWKAAMGDYWPAIGYCRASEFTLHGAGCIAPRR
ncbi:MAG: hypothetical protein ACKV2U_02175 [Bryobacteraceae bacterium]